VLTTPCGFGGGTVTTHHADIRQISFQIHSNTKVITHRYTVNGIPPTAHICSSGGTTCHGTSTPPALQALSWDRSPTFLTPFNTLIRADSCRLTLSYPGFKPILTLL